MPVYNLEKLMDETRRIASEYRQSTGATLPVSAELAKFDAIKLLSLKPVKNQGKAVDALLVSDKGEKKVQVKGRVIFNSGKTSQRVGQLNLDADWDLLFLVLLNNRYETTEIYQVGRDKLLAELTDSSSFHKKQRGAISVKKFKAISQLCWPVGIDTE